MAVVWSYPLQPFDVAAGTAVTAATLTAGTPAPAPVAPPIQQQGTMVRITANGEFSWSTTGGTVVLGFYVAAPGTAIGSAAVLCATGALSIAAGAAAWPFCMKYEGTIRTLSTGSSSNGVIHGQGWAMFGTSLTAMSLNPMPVTAALRTVSTLSTNQNNQFDIGVTLSTATGTPSVTVTDFNVELMG